MFINDRRRSRTGIATPPSMISSHSDLLSTQKEEKKSRKRCHVIRAFDISAMSAPSPYYVAPTELVVTRLCPWKIGNDKSHAVRLRWAGSIALLYWAFKLSMLWMTLVRWLSYSCILCILCFIWGFVYFDGPYRGLLSILFVSVIFFTVLSTRQRENPDDVIDKLASYVESLIKELEK